MLSTEVTLIEAPIFLILSLYTVFFFFFNVFVCFREILLGIGSAFPQICLSVTLDARRTKHVCTTQIAAELFTFNVKKALSG